MQKHLFKSWFAMLCLLVFGVGGAWAQVSTAVATDGKSYILAAYSGGKYYALPQITSAATYSGTEVTVGADGKVASKAGLPIWTLTKNSSNATQFYVTYTNGTNTYYLYKNGTGNTNYNIKGSSTGDKNYWTFTKSSDGKYYNIVAVDRGNTNTYLDFYGSGTNIKWQVRGTSPSMESNNNTSIILLEVGASSEQFSYSIDKIGEGQILFKTAKGDEVKPGDKIDDGTVISPTFTPADGYEFTSWEYYTSMGAWQKITASTFTISKDVKFRVTFTATAPKAKYPVSIETPENGTLTIMDGETVINSGDEVEEGKTLTVGVEPAEGYRFKNWGYKDGDAAWVGNNTATFTHVMPSAACSFKATFEEIPTYTVAFSVNGAIKQTNTYEEGATVTAPTVDDINGKTFVGWVKTSTVDAENSPTYETISKATETVTYYAVFASQQGDAEEIWNKVTNTASLAAGDVVTLVSSTPVDYNKPGTKDKVSGYVAISSQNTNNWKGVGVTIENDVLTTTENVKQFILTATGQDDYPWAFCYDNNYLYASSNSSNQLKSTNDMKADGAKFSVSISNGEAILTANREEGRNTLQVNGSYNSGSTTQNPIFSCYASTATNTNPAIYKKSGGVSYSNFTTTPLGTEEVTVSSVEWATYYTNKAFIMPEGLSGYIMKDNGTKVASEKIYEAGDVVPAETAIMINGEAKTYTLVITNEAGTAAEGNLLKGKLVAGTTDGGNEGAKYYKFANGEKGLGWYYGSAANTTGAPFTTGAKKAYLVLNAENQYNAKGFVSIFNDDEEEATGIANVNAEKSNGLVYNLNGQLVNADAKGIVIINGRKYLKK